MKRIYCITVVLAFLLVCMCAPVTASAAEDTIILLADGASTVTGKGATVEGDVIKITQGGDYKVSGTLSDGQIVVDVGKESMVLLKLAGVNITCSYSAPINVVSADKIEIKLISGTENTLMDTFRSDPEDSDLPGACLYSADDMLIKGTGKLTVYGNNNNGIGTKNDLRINGGVITITALNNAIRGKDSVSIKGGRINIKGCEDGIKSTEDQRPDKGYVFIQGATIYITANDDAIQAVTGVTIRDSSVYTYAEDMAINCDATVDIMEGCLIEN